MTGGGGDREVFRPRTHTEAMEALVRLVDGAWQRPNRRSCFTIPVDQERDADCILMDVINERDALRVQADALADACIVFTDDPLKECRVCLKEWDCRGPEQHRPGCPLLAYRTTGNGPDLPQAPRTAPASHFGAVRRGRGRMTQNSAIPEGEG